MFALRRLGVSGNLAEMLSCTNAIESMISVVRTTMRNVKNWRDGEMKKRWVAAGMLGPNARSGAFAVISKCLGWSLAYAAMPAYLSYPRAIISVQLDQVRPLPKFNKERDILHTRQGGPRGSDALFSRRPDSATGTARPDCARAAQRDIRALAGRRYDSDRE